MARVALAFAAFIGFVVLTPSTLAQSKTQAEMEDDPTQTQPQSAPSVKPGPYWNNIPEQGFLSLAFGKEEETNDEILSGPSVAWGLWDDASDFKGGISFWLSSVSGDRQRITRAGFEILGPFTIPMGPVRVFPTFCIGPEYRKEDPDAGFGGFVSLGVEAAI